MQSSRAEVVRVAGPGFFVNEARQACRYDEIKGCTLAKGYYLALWSARGRRRSVEPRFYGPFADEAQARMLALSAQALGLTQPRAQPKRTAPCAPPARRGAVDHAPAPI